MRHSSLWSARLRGMTGTVGDTGGDGPSEWVLTWGVLILRLFSLRLRLILISPFLALCLASFSLETIGQRECHTAIRRKCLDQSQINKRLVFLNNSLEKIQIDFSLLSLAMYSLSRYLE